jgi:DNA-binding NtrC family response regulator
VPLALESGSQFSFSTRISFGGKALIQTTPKPAIAPNGNGNREYPKDASQTLKHREGAERLQQRLESLGRQAAALTAEIEDVRWLDLGAKLVSIEEGIDLYNEIRRFEISLIVQALKFTHGSQKEAAALLKMNHTTLNSKIKKYQINKMRRRAVNA